jgi:MFS family permease
VDGDLVTNDAQSRHAGIFETYREIPVSGRFVLLGVFINQFGAFLQLFLVLYLTTRGFSGEQASIALGAYSVGAIIGNFGGGTLSDQLGPRWTIVLSMGSAALFTLSVTFLDSFVAIVPIVAIAGAMSQASRPAVTALLLRFVPESRHVMMLAMYRTALNAGMVSGPLVATWLSTISWDLVFWVDAATSLAYCLIAAFLLQADKITPVGNEAAADTAEEAGQPNTVAEAGQGDKAPAATARPRKASYLTVLRDRRYLGYLAIMLANGIVHIQFYVVVPLMLKAEGYPTLAYSTLAATSAAIVVFGGVPITKITQRYPIWVPVIAGWVLLLIGRGAYGLPGGFAIFIIAAAIGATAQIIGGPGAFAYPAQAAPDGLVGRYMASAYAMFGLGYAIGPIAGVALWEHLGRTFWGVVVLFGAVMTLPGLWGMRPPGSAPGRKTGSAEDELGQSGLAGSGADTTTTAESAG